jgi:hypothetical protein
MRSRNRQIGVTSENIFADERQNIDRQNICATFAPLFARQPNKRGREASKRKISA